jgi:drug/metabolite transporter (DMT)-like permease
MTSRNGAARTISDLTKLGLLVAVVGVALVATGQREDQPGGQTIALAGWVVVALGGAALFVACVARAVRLGIEAAREA